MNTGQIIKSKLTDRFTTIPNEFLRRPDLSLKAKGLLCTLLSLPSDWVVNKQQLPDLFTDGYTAIASAFTELEEKGFIISVRVMESGRFKGWNYMVYDTPTTKEETENAEQEPTPPIRDFLKSENPISENQQLLKKDSTKTDSTNLDTDLTVSISPNEPAEEQKQGKENLPSKNQPAEGGKKSPPVAPTPPAERFYRKEYEDVQKTFDPAKLKDNVNKIKTFLAEHKGWPHPEPYMDLWNIFAHIKKVPAAQVANESRKRKISSRVRETAFDFPAILEKANNSAFLSGGSGWTATFDWLIENDSNYVKVLEGNYN
jgi:hypothetical protein